MNPKIIVANWKMNQNFSKGMRLAITCIQDLQDAKLRSTKIILMPPFIHLNSINKLLSQQTPIDLGAQNCHHQASGAFTGEVSAPMLASVGVKFVLIGHSERRQYFGEDAALLVQKINIALDYTLWPIFCCGETLAVREQGGALDFVHQQIKESLFHLKPTEIEMVMIAYEPVWAIGTGKTATPDEIKVMHAAIRTQLAKKYDKKTAAAIPILYGGSCNSQNAKQLLHCPNVDGALVGNASLQPKAFVSIIRAC